MGVRINFRKFKIDYLILVVSAVVVVSTVYAARPKEEVVYPRETVTVPEGYNVEQIDKLLFESGVLNERGSLSSLSVSEFEEYWFLEEAETLEGFLFPDTYEFFLESTPDVVARKFLDNWQKKASYLFMSKNGVLERVILASMVEREVPNNGNDRSLVAGLLLKRRSSGMPLQVDSTLCYIKDKLKCGEVVPSDKNPDSSYNTYKNKGFPPGAISNPGLSAIKAAIAPRASEYWYFISDPKTGKTVFAKTLDEHNQNIVKYLR